LHVNEVLCYHNEAMEYNEVHITRSIEKTFHRQELDTECLQNTYFVY